MGDRKVYLDVPYVPESEEYIQAQKMQQAAKAESERKKFAQHEAEKAEYLATINQVIVTAGFGGTPQEQIVNASLMFLPVGQIRNVAKVAEVAATSGEARQLVTQLVEKGEQWAAKVFEMMPAERQTAAMREHLSQVAPADLGKGEFFKALAEHWGYPVPGYPATIYTQRTLSLMYEGLVTTPEMAGAMRGIALRELGPFITTLGTAGYLADNAIRESRNGPDVRTFRKIIADDEILNSGIVPGTRGNVRSDWQEIISAFNITVQQRPQDQKKIERSMEELISKEGLHGAAELYRSVNTTAKQKEPNLEMN